MTESWYKNICLRESAWAYLSRHNGCSSSNPARYRRYRDHPRWQNLHLLLRKRVGVREGYTTEGKCFSVGHWANLSSCGTMCCWQLLPSESLLCERKAVAVVVGKLWFLQRQEFFSSGNKSWSTHPNEESNICWVSNQNYLKIIHLRL